MYHNDPFVKQRLIEARLVAQNKMRKEPEELVFELGEDSRYSVTSTGRVLSFKQRNSQGRALAIRNRRGYSVVGLFIDGKVVMRTVGRLVAATFLPNYSGQQVYHFDKDGLNSRLENLFYFDGDYIVHVGGRTKV